jgi:putative nucleotidyltransferase with HDIG domain
MDGISREKAVELVRQHIHNDNLFKHCLASEAVLRALAARLGEDVEKWGLAGLLHDLDSETHPDLAVHTRETVRLLTGQGVDPEIIEAIRLHNPTAHPGKTRTTVFQHALAAGETITGLVIATALVQPDRKLASVKPKSVKKQMKEKAFARGASREAIMECEMIGIPIAEFCELSVAAMQGIADSLGM